METGATKIHINKNYNKKIKKSMVMAIKMVVAGLIVATNIVCATGIFELKTKEITLMNTQPYTVWQLLDVLANQPVFTLIAVKKILPINFTERPRNTYFSPWESESLNLADKVMVETIELRIRHEDAISRILIINISPDSPCISLEQVRENFPDGIYQRLPLRRSLDEQSYYSLRQPWGELSFGFKERNPNCLASVVIDRSSPVKIK